MDKKSIVITTAIHKGGSGKSSVSGNLAYSLANLGYKILLIDTDSQMNLSHSYNLSTSDKNFYKVLIEDDNILNNITKTEYENIDFVVGSVSLANAEIKLNSMHLREFKVKEALAPIVDKKDYDFIIIDTSPSLGILNTSVLHATDFVLIPVETTSFGIDGLDIFMDYFSNISRYKKDLSILGIVLNKVDKRENLSEDAKEVVKHVFGDVLLDTEISTDSNIKNAQWERVPLGAYVKKSRAIENFNELAREVVKNVEESQGK